jgi:hypothetical protein
LSLNWSAAEHHCFFAASGLPVSEVCRDMKIGETAVRRWMEQMDAGSDGDRKCLAKGLASR